MMSDVDEVLSKYFAKVRLASFACEVSQLMSIATLHCLNHQEKPIWISRP